MLHRKTHEELLKLARTIVQPLRTSFYKGQAGKIAVFGGCQDYTGAPFFAAHSAALVGADLSHVFCEKQAATVIKGYLPDLMVHPYLYELLNPVVLEFAPKQMWDSVKQMPLEEAVSGPTLDEVIEKHILPQILGALERIDVFVVGPGLGRDPLMLRTVFRIIQEIKVANKPLILDADSLFLLGMLLDLVKGYEKAVITPNVVEFGRLCRAVGIDNDDTPETARKLSEQLGGVCVVKKGREEVIVKGETSLANDMTGSLRRVGGQGDTLTGAMATMLVWAEHYRDGFWDASQEERLGPHDSVVLACYAACALVRRASSKAFSKYNRAMQTSNIHEFLGEAYTELFEETPLR
ncbi:hypothetical protein PUMCH_002769 [Australozyma saopauloensis]|uniref:ATP-dependent (S)-NAD(P)H-hydrate dehydratase n=1 Tax=Australozyma saopauloensis TaxID=291208 RepID=A0AAX4HC36_9ASCO|nr:hypothetical protein PUMCH_002769 [[Candida] saopauloensis]